MHNTDTPTLIGAMRVLAVEIQSGDGIANMAIAEAADRLQELHDRLEISQDHNVDGIMARDETIKAQDQKINKLTDWADLIVDEFQRINSAFGATDEIKQLCERGAKVTKQNVPLIKRFNKLWVKNIELEAANKSLLEIINNLDSIPSPADTEAGE